MPLYPSFHRSSSLPSVSFAAFTGNSVNKAVLISWVVVVKTFYLQLFDCSKMILHSLATAGADPGF